MAFTQSFELQDSPWSKCGCPNCPLEATVYVNGAYMCDFHQTLEPDFHAPASKLIKAIEPLIYVAFIWNRCALPVQFQEVANAFNDEVDAMGLTGQIAPVTLNANGRLAHGSLTPIDALRMWIVTKCAESTERSATESTNATNRSLITQALEKAKHRQANQSPF